MKTNTPISALLMVICAGIMWAGSGIGAQNFFEKSSLSAMELTCFRMVAAGIVLFLICLWLGVWKPGVENLKKKKFLWKDVLIYAVIGLALMHYTYFAAIEVGNAAAATVLLYTNPAMVILYNAVRYRKRPRPQEIITVIMVIAGTFFLVTGGDPSKLDVPLACILLSLFNGAVYAFASMYPKHLFLQMDRTFLLCLGMFIGGFACWLCVPHMNWLAFFDPNIAFGVAWIVLFGTVSAFLLYNAGLQYLSPEQALITAAIEPVASVIMSHFFFGSTFIGLQLLGIALVILAIIAPAVPMPGKRKA